MSHLLNLNKLIDMEDIFPIFNLDFKIDKEISKGGFGKIYLLTSSAGDKLVMKIPLLDTSPNVPSENIRLFREEVLNLLSVEFHPNIVIPFYVDFRSKIPRIFFEYIDENETKFNIPNNLDYITILDIFIQIADGMSHIHNHNIIHRDLKPQNILIKRDIFNNNSRPQVKIIDFGLSKYLNLKENTLYNKGNNYGYYVGTPGYSSPEQQNKIVTNIGKDSDIYSFGVILFETLIGELPSECFIKSDNNLLKHIKRKFSTLKEIEYTPLLVTIIYNCLRYDPKNRWKEEKTLRKFNFFNTIKEKLIEIYQITVGKNYSFIRDTVSKEFFSSWVGYFFRGYYMYEIEKDHEALQMINTSIKLNPKNVQSYCIKSLLLNRIGKRNEALKVVNEAIKLDPSNAEVKYLYGFLSPNYDEAIKLINEAIKLDPSNAEIFFTKAFIIFENDPNNFSLGRNALDETLNLNPNHINALILKHLILIHSNILEALEVLNHANNICPFYRTDMKARILFYRSKILKKLQHTNKAMKDLKDAKNLDEDIENKMNEE